MIEEKTLGDYNMIILPRELLARITKTRLEKELAPYKPRQEIAIENPELSNRLYTMANKFIKYLIR